MKRPIAPKIKDFIPKGGFNPRFKLPCSNCGKRRILKNGICKGCAKNA
jgi:hypothetical protein